MLRQCSNFNYSSACSGDTLRCGLADFYCYLYDSWQPESCVQNELKHQRKHQGNIYLCPPEQKDRTDTGRVGIYTEVSLQ